MPLPPPAARRQLGASEDLCAALQRQLRAAEQALGGSKGAAQLAEAELAALRHERDMLLRVGTWQHRQRAWGGGPGVGDMELAACGFRDGPISLPTTPCTTVMRSICLLQALAAERATAKQVEAAGREAQQLQLDSSRRACAEAEAHAAGAKAVRAVHGLKHVSMCGPRVWHTHSPATISAPDPCPPNIAPMPAG